MFDIEAAPIEPFVPMMLFAIVFGLSMDDEVFLLSRVREEWDRTGDSPASVAAGLAPTARVITAAAAIMVVVFASFLGESDRIVKLLGLGLSMAVLIDATIVRLLLVPATMELLGDDVRVASDEQSQPLERAWPGLTASSIRRYRRPAPDLLAPGLSGSADGPKLRRLGVDASMSIGARYQPRRQAKESGGMT